MQRMRLRMLALIGFGAMAFAAGAQQELTPRERAADAAVGVFMDKPTQAAAQTTRDPDDDARIDRRLERYARMSAGERAIQAALYRRLIDRAAARRDGQRRALQYQIDLSRAQPRHRWCAARAMAERYRLAYDEGDRAERTEMAEPFVGVLLSLIQRHDARWEIDEALELHREALAVARAARSPYREVLDDYGRVLTSLRREAQRLDAMRAQFENGAISPSNARVLAVRLAAERSDIQGAALAADAADDATLASALRLAAAAVEDLEPAQALAVADTFAAIADDPALTLDRAKLNALQEAQFYYQHYLFLSAEQDVARLGVVQRSEALSPRIAALRPDPIRRPAGPWRSLVGGIAEPRVGNRGNLINGQHLRVRNNTVYAHESSFTVPVRLDAAYDMRMGITRTHANNPSGMALYFPIGAARGGRLVLGVGGENSCRIQGVTVIERLANFRFPEDRTVAMVLGVYPQERGEVHLTLSLDGVVVLDWTGPVNEFNVGGGQQPPQSHGNIFRIDARTTYEFQQIEVRRAAEQ